MERKIIYARVQQKKDTLANWNANTLIPLNGEPCFVVDDNGGGINFKLGDGVRLFKDLPWFNIVITGESVVVVDNIAALRALSSTIIALLNTGVLKAVEVLGYYVKGDTPNSIKYYISTTTATDNGGSVIASNTSGYYFLHDFIGDINVKYFGAKGNGVANDTTSFKNALTYATIAVTALAKGAIVFVPKGQYIVDKSQINVPIDVTLKGEGVSSMIYGDSVYTDINAYGVKLNGQRASIEGIYVRGYAVGITYVEQPYVSIIKCYCQYNRIGIKIDQAYISCIKDNVIMWNQVGIVSLRQSYEVLIKDNIIDNNISSSATEGGGLGVYLSGSIGIKLEDNTIEGNRNTNTGIGCGLYINGLGTSLVVRGNWFETNYNSGSAAGDGEYPSDIFLNGETTTAFQTAIQNGCIPTEYRENLGCRGSITIADNFHFTTKNALVVSYWNFGLLQIHGNVYTGSLGRYNRPVLLNLPTTHFANYNCEIDIDNNFVQNTQGTSATTTEQMYSGIQSTYVHGQIPISSNGVLLKVNYHKKNLRVLEVTPLEVVSKLGGVYSSTFFIASGNARVFNNSLLNNTYLGTNKSTGSVGLFGTNILPPATAFTHVVCIGAPKSGFLYNTTTGFTNVLNESEEFGMLTIKAVSSSVITSTTMYVGYDNSPIYGYIFITQAIYDKWLKGGVTHVKVKDFQVNQVIPRESLPLAANRLGQNGDMVLNTATGAPIAVYNGSWVNVS